MRPGPTPWFGGWPEIVGVGVETADLLVHEMLLRPMRDRRAVARGACPRAGPKAGPGGRPDRRAG